MSADELLGEGKLGEALVALQDQIRKDPSDAKLRTFLFQLMAVEGNWERALTQLNVAAELDPAALAMAQMYREAIRCELLRKEIFAGRHTPIVFGEPSEWIGLLLESLRLTASADFEAAGKLRSQAFEAAPATSGKIDGQSFEWIADGDSRLGPVIEAVVNGRYYWVPIQNIRQIDLEEPADLRDVVWTPVHFMWKNGGEVVGVIPTRYAGSESSEDSSIRLARKTIWQDEAGDAYTGLGQRMLVTDIGDFSLMDVRKIEFDVGESAVNDSELAAENDLTEDPQLVY